MYALQVISDLEASKYQLVEWRISIYGRKASEWSQLANWFYDYKYVSLAYQSVRESVCHSVSYNRNQENRQAYMRFLYCHCCSLCLVVLAILLLSPCYSLLTI